MYFDESASLIIKYNRALHLVKHATSRYMSM